MIEFKPIDIVALDDPELKARADKHGWIKLPVNVTFGADDFEVAYLKINNIVFTEPSAEFWDEYRKTKIWDRLAHD